MKKSILLILIISITITVIALIFLLNESQDSEFEEFKTEVNNYCEETSCAPYIQTCRHWRSTSYDPYKHCYYSFRDLIEQKSKEKCMQLERDDLSVYCLALILEGQKEECFERAGDDRKLNALCHLSDFGQELYFENLTAYNPTPRFEEEIYYIMGDCSENGGDCQTLIWREEI